MTPKQLLYDTPYERNDKNLFILQGCYYNHIKELEALTYPGVALNSEKNQRVEIRYYKDFDFDHRRFWRLASVWLDDEPVMIIQNAGREGDDHAARFIVDQDRFNEMIKYLVTCCKVENPDFIQSDIVDIDQEMGCTLTDFYGHSLEYFEKY